MHVSGSEGHAEKVVDVSPCPRATCLSLSQNIPLTSDLGRAEPLINRPVGCLPALPMGEVEGMALLQSQSLMPLETTQTHGLGLCCCHLSRSLEEGWGDRHSRGCVPEGGVIALPRLMLLGGAWAVLQYLGWG